MRKWLYTAVALLCAAFFALIYMGTALVDRKNEMPAVIDMQIGEVSDFAPVGLSMVLSDQIYPCKQWWDQTVSFDEEIHTRSLFHSQTKAAERELSRHSTTLQAQSWLWEELLNPETSGVHYVKDVIDRYTYSISVWEEWDDRMMVTEIDFPWLWSAVGSTDSVTVESYGNSGYHTTTGTSEFAASMDLIRANGNYYFTLPNWFHGQRVFDKDGNELEEIAYGGSSGIFRLMLDEEGEPVYDYDENGEGRGLAQAEQLFALPISSELDNIVLRLDHLEELQLLSLLTSEKGVLTLRLFDIGTGTCSDPIPLGSAFVNETDAEDGVPDEIMLKAQNDKILMLMGGFGDQPSRALVLQVETLNSISVLLDVTFDIENRNYRKDEWMLFDEGILYFLEGNEWWDSELRLAAVDKTGIRAFGILKNETAAIETAAAGTNFDYASNLPLFFADATSQFLGWGEISLHFSE